MASKEIALALGSGGIKGHAHNGVLRVLRREGYRVRAIAGTSAGGLWGSFFAAGVSPDEVEAYMAGHPDHTGLYAREPEDGPALMGLGGVRSMLIELLGDRTFEEMEIAFAVTAVDLDTTQEVILNRGRVRDAALATIAVPGIFPPQSWNGRRLIDGGLRDPVPVRLARALAPGLPVVAVALSPVMETWMELKPPRLLDALPFVSGYIARHRFTRALNVVIRSVDISAATMIEMRLALDRPEVVIRPRVPQLRLLDDVDIRLLNRLGEEAAEQALPALEAALGWRTRLALRVQHRPSLADSSNEVVWAAHNRGPESNGGDSEVANKPNIAPIP